jgi:hypothetical protein
MEKSQYEYILIREATILVRLPREACSIHDEIDADFFDVRTGVQLPRVYPKVDTLELQRGHVLTAVQAGAIIRDGVVRGMEVVKANPAKIVTILDMKQRKLDSVVADSVLDQVRRISEILKEFMEIADAAPKEERFWLSQQVLTLARKFSGRELLELEETVHCFKNRPRRK